MKKQFQRDVLIDAVYDAALIDKNIFILSADFGAPALDRFRAELSSQFYHLGISEQNLIDVAIGMALKGKKIFTYAMAPFISMRCTEQHKLASMMNLPIVNIIAGVGLGYANAGPTHYSTEDYSVAVNTIGSSVYTISSPRQAKGFVDNYFDNPHHCFVRLDRAPMENIGPVENFIEGFRFLSDGEKICVVSHGFMVNETFSILEKNKLLGKVALIDLFGSKPLSKSFLNKVSLFEKIIFVDEQVETSSLGTFLIPKLISNGIKADFENITLIEKFMFENVGRNKLIELGGINEKIILEKIAS